MNLNYLSATEALAAMDAGEVSSEALVRSCLYRIDEREADVHAWAALDRDGALVAAREADRTRRGGKGGGPLLGIPVGIKDNIATANLPTEYNSTIYRGHRPGSDAPVIELLRLAGAIILGKTATVEFAAHGRPAPTRNPHDLTRSPSGSSSGSAAAVADGMVPLAIGTQTGGSLIRPGSYCGCIAFKPSYGTVSTEGVKLISISLDTVGWYARSVADIELVARALEVADGPILPPPLDTLRIGLFRTPFWERARPASCRAVEDAARRFVAAGAKVQECQWDREFAEANELQETIMVGEGYFAFLNLLRLHPDEIAETIRQRMVRIPAETLIAAADKAAILRPRFDRMAREYDAILTPAAPGEAPIGRNIPADTTFNGAWTLLHVPCITLAGLAGPAGMPVGVQLVAPRRADAQLLGVARAIAPLLQPQVSNQGAFPWPLSVPKT